MHQDSQPFQRLPSDKQTLGAQAHRVKAMPARLERCHTDVRANPMRTSGLNPQTIPFSDARTKHPVAASEFADGPWKYKKVPAPGGAGDEKFCAGNQDFLACSALGLCTGFLADCFLAVAPEVGH